MTIIIGLDISLKSPGIAVSRDDKIYAMYFEQRKHSVPPTTNDKVSLTALPLLLDASHSDMDRYQQLVAASVKWLCGMVPNKERASAIVYVEGYAFTRSAYNYKLHEVTGILKFMLHQSGFTCQVVPVTTWKRQLTGNAFADKYQVLQTVNRRLNVDLAHLLQTKLSPAKPLKGRKRRRGQNLQVMTRSVPTPLQDVADAIGIVLSQSK